MQCFIMLQVSITLILCNILPIEAQVYNLRSAREYIGGLFDVRIQMPPRENYKIRLLRIGQREKYDFSMLCSEGIPLLMQDHKPRPCQPRPWKDDQRCPSGFWCHEGDDVSSYYCCPKSRKFFNHCHLPAASGFGKQTMRRFYYDWKTDGCHELTYTGIGGNENSYITYELCEKACRGAGEPPLKVSYENTTKLEEMNEKQNEKDKDSLKKKIIKVNVSEPSATEMPFTTSSVISKPTPKTTTQIVIEPTKPSTSRPTTKAPTTTKPFPQTTVTSEPLEEDEPPGGNPCNLPPERGLNGGVAKKMWYFDLSMMSCVEFAYLGRKGNSNRFSSFDACFEVCGIGKPTRKSCRLPVSVGNGPYEVARYFFNSISGQCEQFLYSGKDGNDNRFFKKHKCERLCIPRQPKKPKEVVQVVEDKEINPNEVKENTVPPRYPWPEPRPPVQQNRYRTTEKIIETEETTHPTLIFNGQPSTGQIARPSTAPPTLANVPMTSPAPNIDLIFQQLMTAPTRYLISMTETPVYETTTPSTFTVGEIPEVPVEQLPESVTYIPFPIWEVNNNHASNWEKVDTHESPYETNMGNSLYTGNSNTEIAHSSQNQLPPISVHLPNTQQEINYYNINQLKPPPTELSYVPYQPQLLERIPVLPVQVPVAQLPNSGYQDRFNVNVVKVPDVQTGAPVRPPPYQERINTVQGIPGAPSELRTVQYPSPAGSNGHRLHSWSTGMNSSKPEIPTYLAVNSRPMMNSFPGPIPERSPGPALTASELGDLLTQIANLPISQIPNAAHSSIQQLHSINNQVDRPFIPYSPMRGPAQIFVPPLQMTTRTPSTSAFHNSIHEIPGHVPGSTIRPPTDNNEPPRPKININIEEDVRKPQKSNLTIEIIENLWNSPCMFPLPTYSEPVIMCESENSCPAGTFCQIGDGQSICCPDIGASSCTQPLNEGTGVSQLSRWFYDKDMKLCKTFQFKGFQGNSNNFGTYSECERSCDAVSVCQHGQPREPEYPNEECSSTNPCPAGFMCHSIDGWSFCCPVNPDDIQKEVDKVKPMVIPIVPSTSKVPDQCDQPVNSGYGQSFLARYFYSREYDQCLHFIFTGEGGNSNNFATLEECLEICIANGVRFSSLGMLGPNVLSPSVIPPLAPPTLSFLPAAVCPKGIPLQDHSGNIVYCRNNKDCPYDHVCRMQDQRSFCCPAPESFCLQQKPTENNCPHSPSTTNQIRFVYDASYDKCVRFEFSNCGHAPSSLNFFTSLPQCRRLCCNQGLNLVYKRKLLALSDDPLPDE